MLCLSLVSKCFLNSPVIPFTHALFKSTLFNFQIVRGFPDNSCNKMYGQKINFTWFQSFEIYGDLFYGQHLLYVDKNWGWLWFLQLLTVMFFQHQGLKKNFWGSPGWLSHLHMPLDLRAMSWSPMLDVEPTFKKFVF